MAKSQATTACNSQNEPIASDKNTQKIPSLEHKLLYLNTSYSQIHVPYDISRGQHKE